MIPDFWNSFISVLTGDPDYVYLFWAGESLPFWVFRAWASPFPFWVPACTVTVGWVPFLVTVLYHHLPAPFTCRYHSGCLPTGGPFRSMPPCYLHWVHLPFYLRPATTIHSWVLIIQVPATRWSTWVRIPFILPTPHHSYHSTIPVSGGDSGEFLWVLIPGSGVGREATWNFHFRCRSYLPGVDSFLYLDFILEDTTIFWKECGVHRFTVRYLLFYHRGCLPVHSHVRSVLEVLISCVPTMRAVDGGGFILGTIFYSGRPPYLPFGLPFWVPTTILGGGHF